MGAVALFEMSPKAATAGAVSRRAFVCWEGDGVAPRFKGLPILSEDIGHFEPLSVEIFASPSVIGTSRISVGGLKVDQTWLRKHAVAGGSFYQVTSKLNDPQVCACIQQGELQMNASSCGCAFLMRPSCRFDRVGRCRTDPSASGYLGTASLCTSGSDPQ